MLQGGSHAALGTAIRFRYAVHRCSSPTFIPQLGQIAGAEQDCHGGRIALLERSSLIPTLRIGAIRWRGPVAPGKNLARGFEGAGVCTGREDNFAWHGPHTTLSRQTQGTSCMPIGVPQVEQCSVTACVLIQASSTIPQHLTAWIVLIILRPPHEVRDRKRPDAPADDSDDPLIPRSECKPVLRAPFLAGAARRAAFYRPPKQNVALRALPQKKVAQAFPPGSARRPFRTGGRNPSSRRS